MSAPDQPVPMREPAPEPGGGLRSALWLLFEMIEPRDRIGLFALLSAICLVSVLEALSVASIVPLVSNLLNASSIDYFPTLAKIKAWFGIEANETFMLLIAVGFGLLLLASLVLRTLTFYWSTQFAARFNERWSNMMMQSYLHRSYSWHLHQHSSGLSWNALKIVQEAVSGVLTPALALVSSGLMVLLIAVLILRTLPVAATIAGVLLALFYTAIYFLLRKNLNAVSRSKHKADELRHRLVNESLGGIKDIKIYGLEQRYNERLQAPSHAYAFGLAKQQLYGQLPRYFIEGVAYLSLTAIMIYFFLRSGTPERAMALLSMFGFAALRLLPAVQNCYHFMVQIRTNYPAIFALHGEIYRYQPPDTKQLLVSERLALNEQLQLTDIRYSYQGAQQKTIRSISLSISARQTVAFIGASGAGKTTLADIILGLLRPDSGSISADGVPINADNLLAWQQNLGYVPQSIFLVDASIADNIAFGIAPEQQDMQQIKAAAKIAALHDFIEDELPEGYQTRIGERGIRLSGGQRQRLGIARALYRNPQLLICDEATSALDNVTESAVMDAIADLHHEKTVIIIAHRLSTVRRCDQIFLFAQGQLVAQGRYDELLRDNALFQKMAASGRIDELTD